MGPQGGPIQVVVVREGGGRARETPWAGRSQPPSYCRLASLDMPAPNLYLDPQIRVRPPYHPAGDAGLLQGAHLALHAFALCPGLGPLPYHYRVSCHISVTQS
jgi:hypothetical protein